VETVTDPLGGVTRYAYDALGRQTAETNPNGETTSYAYDALGRVLSVTDPNGNSEAFAYDALGRILTASDPNGAVALYAYDASGNVIRLVEKGVTSDFEYDALNRLTKATINGKADRVTLYEYDGRGLVTRTVNALGDGKAYTYDANGNLLSETDEDGFVTEYAYNALNLVQSINYSGGKSVQFRYDAAGRLVEMEDWTGRTSFTLDLLGRITEVNDRNKVTGYAYDANGNQSGITYPDGSSVAKTYDALNRLAGVTDADGTVSYTYDSAGLVQSMLYPNGISELYTYDPAGRLLEITQEQNGASEPLNSFAYDAAGNIVENEGAGTGDARLELVTGEYNGLNQMTSRTVMNLLGGVTGEYTYTYDRRGNLVEETETLSGDVKTYEYDATNKMVRGVNANGEVSEYTYNGLGILVSHAATDEYGVTVATDFVVDYTSEIENNLMAYVSDGIQYRYAYGLGLGKISATVNGTLKLYIQNDRLGSGRFASDATGVRVAHTYLDMWGYVYSQEKAEFGGKTINILDNFTNHDYDEILGIYYANARFYDPVMMRFLASDPARDGLNWYTYADGNPLRFVDPTGLSFFGDVGNFFAGIGKGIAKGAAYWWNGVEVMIRGETKEVLDWASEDGSFDWESVQDAYYDGREELLNSDNIGLQILGGISMSVASMAKGAYELANVAVDAAIGVADGIVEGFIPTYDSTWDPTHDELYYGTKIIGNGVVALLSIAGIFAGAAITTGGAALVPVSGPGGVAVSALGIALVGITSSVLVQSVEAAIGSYGDIVDYFDSPNGYGGSSSGEGSSVDELSKEIAEWLGSDSRVITNDSGDKIFLSKDGTRRVRFDMNRPNPHNNPHMHFEELIDGKWKSASPDISQIYPRDVPHN
jgi:RHS repeat-associated protein